MMFAALLAASTMGTPTLTSTVLARAREAMGGATLAQVRTLHLHERVSALGVSGTGDEWDDLQTGRFVQLAQAGPLSSGDGYDGTHAWSQDATGLAHVNDSPDDLAGAVSQAYTTSLSYLFPNRVQATVTSEQGQSIGSTRYFVVRATPYHGYPVDLWFDEQTYLLRRSIVQASGAGRVVANDYADYRTVDGIVIPFDVHINDSRGNQFETQITSVDIDPNEQVSYALPRSAPNDFSLAAGAKSTTLPIQIINNHIFLNARVNGKGPLRFILDTGGLAVLNPDVAASFGIQPVGNFQGGGAGAGTVQTGFAWVPKIQLGDATLTHQAAAVLPLGAVMQAVEGVHIDGMIGYETVARYLTTIDYEHGTLTLTPRSAGLRPQGTPVPFVFYQTIPLVRGTFDGIPATFEIDTGARSDLTLMSPFVAAHGLDTKFPTSVSGVTGFGIGGPTSARVARVSSISLGSVAIPDVITDFSTDTQGALADASISGNIGGGVLRRFVVTFDYQNGVMYLRKNADFEHHPPFDRSGLVLVAVPSGIRVISVLTSTPGETAGLKAHDLIEAVNGVPVDQLGLNKIRDMLRGPAGTTLKLTVSDGTTTRTAVLTLKDYV